MYLTSWLKTGFCRPSTPGLPRYAIEREPVVTQASNLVPELGWFYLC